MDAGSENARGAHAIRVLEGRTDFTLDGLLAAAFDSYLPAFEQSIPELVKAWGDAPESHALKEKLREPVEVLVNWDLRWDTASVATSLAVFFGEAAGRAGGAGRRGGGAGGPRLSANEQALQSLAAAVERLEQDFGTWKTPWGDINRFQRLTGDIIHVFNDSASSIPVGFTSARWGSLASFSAAPRNGMKKWYGTSGNSFVAVVEFGADSVRARAITAGGESGNPSSPHFNDQAERYATGNLRPVYFYRGQLQGHTEREYRPGQRR
jgi:acyl-homoserine lactone acylase PvdQ